MSRLYLRKRRGRTLIWFKLKRSRKRARHCPAGTAGREYGQCADIQHLRLDCNVSQGGVAGRAYRAVRSMRVITGEPPDWICPMTSKPNR
jgi:hypothetical protein